MFDPKSIDVLDLGINNISSVVSGLKAAAPHVNVNVATGPGDTSANPSLTVLPGNGSFGAGMAALEGTGLGSYLKNLEGAGEPIFGICLGLQLLFDSSEEAPGAVGLGLIDGVVRRLPVSSNKGVQTNIGWAPLSVTGSSVSQFKFEPLLRDVYFVHSYYVDPEIREDIILESRYENFTFAAAVKRNNTIGVQFHPEKSSNSGIEIIKSIVEWARAKD
jgi:imidazole glycerol-phosphate synthase subunit HisH